MKIKFKKDTWVLKKTIGGFAGVTIVKAVLIKPEPFDVITVENKKRYSDIYVGNDGKCDGYCTYLINVPNSLFELWTGQ